MKFAHFLLAVLPLAVSNPAPDYRKLSPEEAERLASWDPNSKQALWELSGQYQRDKVVLAPSQQNGITYPTPLWINRELPYEISSKFMEQEKEFITQTLEEQFSKTCIKVRPRTSTDRDYVYITAEEKGCLSYVGRQGGRQPLNLDRNGCLNTGSIVHQFLHALGFYHERSAIDRLPKDPTPNIEESDGLSDADIIKISKKYNCA